MTLPLLRGSGRVADFRPGLWTGLGASPIFRVVGASVSERASYRQVVVRSASGTRAERRFGMSLAQRVPCGHLPYPGRGQHKTTRSDELAA